jgi:hypothetical protein
VPGVVVAAPDVEVLEREKADSRTKKEKDE